MGLPMRPSPMKPTGSRIALFCHRHGCTQSWAATDGHRFTRPKSRHGRFEVEEMVGNWELGRWELTSIATVLGRHGWTRIHTAQEPSRKIRSRRDGWELGVGALGVDIDRHRPG